jgi:CheY-like chemotaxis protein
MRPDRSPSVHDQILRLRQILDSSPALIHTARPDGYLDFFNRTWREFVGKPVEELYGWKWTSCESGGLQKSSCVITDVEMGQISGLGLLHHINGTASSLPVVIITGKPTEKSESFYLERERSASFVNRLTAMLWSKGSLSRMNFGVYPRRQVAHS